MSDQRRFVRRSGRLTSTPLTDFWQISTTVQDPAVPNMPMETPSGGAITITGTLVVTDGLDTAAFIGDLAHVGTLAATDAADTAALSGDLAHVGTLVATDGADTFAAEGAVEAQSIAGPIIYLDGGGAARRVKRRKERKNKPLWEDMAEVYDVLMDIGSAPEVAEVVAEYVEPAKPAPAVRSTVAIIQPPQIDWRALARDMETVYRLVALYEKARADQQDEEEAEMLLLM